MKIIIHKVPISLIREIPEQIMKAMVGLEVETCEYDAPWLRLGDPNLAPNGDNFYTVKYRNIFIALNKKNPRAARELSFQISSEIKFFIIEKCFCKEKTA